MSGTLIKPQSVGMTSIYGLPIFTPPPDAGISAAKQWWPRPRTGLQAPGSAAYTTALLANGARESGLVLPTNIGTAGAFRLYTLTLDHPGRVRLYTSTAKRDADAGRIPGVDPTGAHGVIIDFVAITGALGDTVSPVVYAWLEGAPAQIPITIDNLSGSATSMTATMTLARTE